MKVAFDFDNTLERIRVQNIAKQYIEDGDEVWIITRRSPEDNEDLYSIANQLGITSEHIIFTSGEWKYKVLYNSDFDILYDDKIEEILRVRKNTDVKGILI